MRVWLCERESGALKHAAAKVLERRRAGGHVIHANSRPELCQRTCQGAAVQSTRSRTVTVRHRKDSSDAIRDCRE